MEGPFYTYLYILDKLIFQNEVQRVLYKLVLVTYPLYHSREFTALQTSGLLKKQKKSNLSQIPYMGMFS